MTDAAAFWDRIAEKYARDPIGDETSYRYKLDYTQGLFSSQDRVLEIACGTGTTALHHAPHVAHILATDISANMIAIAEKKRVAAGVDNITFRQDTLENLPPDDTGFDMIMAHSILHLVDDAATTIRQAAARLKPGGYLVSSTACLPWFLRPLATLSPALALTGKMPRFSNMTPAKLEEMHINAGLTVTHRWKPEKGMAVFIVAQKPVAAAA